jgi:hypothetical protein
MVWAAVTLPRRKSTATVAAGGCVRLIASTETGTAYRP